MPKVQVNLRDVRPNTPFCKRTWEQRTLCEKCGSTTHTSFSATESDALRREERLIKEPCFCCGK